MANKKIIIDSKIDLDSKIVLLLICTAQELNVDMTRKLKQFNLSIIQLQILHALSESEKGELTVNQIKSVMVDESPNVSRALNKLMNSMRDMVDLLEVIYDLYCKGYDFFRVLGLAYILYGIDELPMLRVEKLWGEKSFIKKREVLNKVSPKLVAEAKRILELFDNGLIKITNEFEYEDFRKDEDKMDLIN